MEIDAQRVKRRGSMQVIKRFPRITLINPQAPPSFWGFQRAAGFLGAKAAHIPLSLITIAALLPKEWQVRLVDMNVQRLKARDITRADVVLVTGMICQMKSLEEVLLLCKQLGVPTIVGGPFVSSSPDAEALRHATSLAIGEAEDDAVMSVIIEDIKAGQLKERYIASGRPPMSRSPTPRYDLLRRNAYCAMAIQVSRGCPHLCEFCNVRILFGKRPRYKTASQVTDDLTAIHATGYRGNIFIVDDNFIGNTRTASEIVDAIGKWQRESRHPFLFYTEADIRLAKKTTLARKMVDAGFFGAFIGFESPSADALKETSKHQNVKINAIEAVRDLGRMGFMIYGGFIVGFDADGPEIFSALESFIEETGIDFAMIGILMAIQGTALEERMRREGRLLRDSSGDALDTSNIIPKSMTTIELIRGYRMLCERLYEPRRFFGRAWKALSQWRQGNCRRFTFRELLAVPKSIFRQGVLSEYRWEYWRFMLRVIRKDPRKIPRAFAQCISGHHFFRYIQCELIPRLREEEVRLLSAGTTDMV
jgi:radical SAM superfamily enzyme YgiQ (UPF0313 family)